MDNNSNKSGNNFFSGFLLGALVGAAIVFLFGTKKGKRVLKVISKESMGNISNILEKVDKSVNLDEVLEDDPSFAKSSVFANASAFGSTKSAYGQTKSADKSAGKESNGEEESSIEKTKPKTKRFFRGISKRFN